MHSYASQNLVKLYANLRTIPEALYRRFSSLASDGAPKTKEDERLLARPLCAELLEYSRKAANAVAPTMPEIDWRTLRRTLSGTFPQTDRIRRFPGVPIPRACSAGWIPRCRRRRRCYQGPRAHRPAARPSRPTSCSTCRRPNRPRRFRHRIPRRSRRACAR